MKIRAQYFRQKYASECSQKRDKSKALNIKFSAALLIRSVVLLEYNRKFSPENACVYLSLILILLQIQEPTQVFLLE